MSETSFKEIESKVEAGLRLDDSEALFLFESNDLNRLGNLANRVNERRNGNRATYLVNRYIITLTTVSSVVSSAPFLARKGCGWV